MELIISSKDYNTIKSLIQQIDIRQQIKEAYLMDAELKKMNIVKDEMMPKHIVGINSSVKVHELSSGKTMDFRITLPSLANVQEKKISIFAPISIALLGFKKGDEIEWNMPGGLKKLKIINVINEA